MHRLYMLFWLRHARTVSPAVNRRHSGIGAVLGCYLNGSSVSVKNASLRLSGNFVSLLLVGLMAIITKRDMIDSGMLVLRLERFAL